MGASTRGRGGVVWEGEDNGLTDCNGNMAKHGRGATCVSERCLREELLELGSGEVTIGINE